MFLPALLLATLLTDLPIDRIVLRAGQVVPVSGAVQIDGERVVFRNVAGVLYSVHVDEVDMTATLVDPAERPSLGRPPAPREARKLTVTPEERERLLAELATNHSGTPPPEQRSLTAEGLQEELDRRDAEREASAGDEARWREQARVARERVAMRRDEVAALQEQATRLEDLVKVLFSRGGYSQDALAGQLLELERTRSRLDAARNGLRSAERAWNDLQERARREGVLPGWLR